MCKYTAASSHFQSGINIGLKAVLVVRLWSVGDYATDAM